MPNDADNDVLNALAEIGIPLGEEPPPYTYENEGESTVTFPEPHEFEGVVALGYDRGSFFYLSIAQRQVVELTAGAHTKNALASLASVAHFWERKDLLKNAKGNGINWDKAVDWLMGECRRVGIYNPEIIRGRGAWLDKGRSVLHVGDQLLVDGVVSPLVLQDSHFVYEAAKHLTDANAEPLATSEAHKLVDICDLLRWEKPVSGILLAGWLAIAAIGGGLAWRSSLWITGGSGSGKSFVKDSIVTQVLGSFAVYAIGSTTEPALRRTLRSDARPVVFEEAEAEDAQAKMRFNAILGLMRQSSSEGRGAVLKADNNGGVDAFAVRSAFCFFGINPPVSHQADENRITFLGLRNGDTSGDGPAAKASEAKFEVLKRLAVETLTPEFSAGLLARSVRLLPVIRANAETFARAISIRFGSRRLGDQLGTLLAGAYSLHSSNLIGDNEAAVFVDKHEWEQTASAEVVADEVMLLSHLTQHRVRFGRGNVPAIETTIGKMIYVGMNFDDADVMSADLAYEELLTHGIRIDRDAAGALGVYVSTNHPALKRLLAGTQWGAKWSLSLGRLAGAMPSAAPKRFGPGHMSRATWIPWATIDPAQPEI